MSNELLIINLLISKYTLDEVHKLKLLMFVLVLLLSKNEQKKDASDAEVNSSDKSSIDDSQCKNSIYKENTTNSTDIINSTASNTANVSTNTNTSFKTNISINDTTVNSSDENILNLLKNGFQGTNTTLLLTTGETLTGQVLGSYYGNVIMIKVGDIIKFIDGNCIIGFY